MTRYRVFSLIITLVILTCACGFIKFDQTKGTQFLGHPESRSTNISWVQTDLRLLDPPDALLPSQDVIAAYTRKVKKGKLAPFGNFLGMNSVQEVQVRLDFLDLGIQNHSDIYLAIDHLPGGVSEWPWGADAQISWDTLLLLPASGQIQAWGIHDQDVKNLAIRVIRNPMLDTLDIHLDANGLPGSNTGYRIQVITTPAGETEIADHLAPFHSSDYPPKPSQVLLAFWNALPAYTPAQALRRWDGAHTGPLGGRHGLYNLLRTARSHKVPLALLDLKSPISLSALDYVDGVPLVQKMAHEGLLILPETVPFLPGVSAQPATVAMPASSLTQLTQLSRQTGLDFGLNASQLIFSPLNPGLPNKYSVILTKVHAQSDEIGTPPWIVSPLRWRERVVIPMPEALLPEQATIEGVSLETRKALVWAALSTNMAMRNEAQPILILGGDLPASEWGAPQIARAAFSYLAAHPWIRFVGIHDLLSARPQKNLSSLQATSPPDGSSISMVDEATRSQIIDLISHLQTSPISQAAWQALISLYGPLSPQPDELSSLRAVYANQLEVLVAAAQWSVNPTPFSTCNTDIDLDGQVECLLGSDEILAVFESGTGSLTYLFVKSSSGFHQVIAPSSQFAVGLSESSDWELDEGLHADPDVIPGAFTDEQGLYQARLDPPQLTFSSQEITKSFRLITGGIRVEYSASHPVYTRLPLALDPWVRFTPAWGERYSWSVTPGGGVWKLASGLSVQIRSNAQINVAQFGETRKMMGSTENPNTEYPPGHFLPFPLAVINLQAPGGFFMEILLIEP